MQGLKVTSFGRFPKGLCSSVGRGNNTGVVEGKISLKEFS